MTKKFRVVYICRPAYFNQYPEIYRKHTLELPHLIDYLKGYSGIFVIPDTDPQGPINERHYPADEFFRRVWVEEVTAEVVSDNEKDYIWPERFRGI